MIILWRLDDRLIHGQVISVLVPKLNIGAIATISKSIAEDTFRQELYRLACPHHLVLHFVSVDEASQHYEKWLHDSKRYILLFEKPQDMHLLAQMVGVPPEINLANLGHQAGREMLFESLYLDEAEKAALNSLTELGAKIFYQQVPNGDLHGYLGVRGK